MIGTKKEKLPEVFLLWWHGCSLSGILLTIVMNHTGLRNTGIFRHISMLENNFVIRRYCSSLFFNMGWFLFFGGHFRFLGEWPSTVGVWDWVPEEVFFICKGPKVLWLTVIHRHFRKPYLIHFNKLRYTRDWIAHFKVSIDMKLISNFPSQVY